MMKKSNHHKPEQSGSAKFQQALYDVDMINDIVDSMPGFFI